MKGAAMERSNYEAFMDCLNPMITITRAILCGVVMIWYNKS